MIGKDELANLKADLDDLISRVNTLSDLDLEDAKERLIKKIGKIPAQDATGYSKQIQIASLNWSGVLDRPGAQDATGGSKQIVPGIESGDDVNECPIKATAADLSAVLHSANFEDFLGLLRAPHPGISTLSPKRFTEALSIDIQTLAKQAHVHRNTISRAPESESVQRFLREALRVLRAAMDVSDDIGDAIFWYRNDPLPVFGYKTAEQLVTEGRAEDLLRYIESLEAGAAG